MKAANNPNGTPRVRKTWRLDNDLLVRLTMYCSKNNWPECEVVEDAIEKYLNKHGFKDYIQKLKK